MAQSEYVERPPVIVAQITKDYISEGHEDSQVNREFHFGAMHDWWGWGDLETNPKTFLDGVEKTEFKLYDDDGELYFEGWLLNDDECFVQQFVQSWGEHFAGCTRIEILSKNAEWIQEIG